MAETGLTRRRVLKTAGYMAGALSLPFVHGAHAAGKLSAFFWDHPVPSVPPAMRKLCEAWAAKEKIDLQLDFVSTNGDKILLTVAAEGQARSGHDIATIPSWYVSGQVDRLEPVDDLIPPLVEQNGKLDWTAEYLGKFDGHWAALPVSTGSPTLPACARIDLMKRHAGIDIAGRVNDAARAVELFAQRLGRAAAGGRVFRHRLRRGFADGLILVRRGGRDARRSNHR